MSSESRVSLKVGPNAVGRLFAMLGGLEGESVSACDVAWMLDISVTEAISLLQASQAQYPTDRPDRLHPYVNDYGQFIVEGK